ncbi:hypothetical protein E4T56_gene14326, partial [Termitomyces sp. T112]
GTASAGRVRVQAGRASPRDERRADVAEDNAEAGVERAKRLAEAARANLTRRIGRPITGTLNSNWLDNLPAKGYGPLEPINATGTLALAAANADLAVADAGVRLARSQRVPDLNVGPGVRHIAPGDVAFVVTFSMPIPVFNSGSAAVSQASAQRVQAEAQKRMTALDMEQAITDAQAEEANAATTARTANGPALAAAQEAARIARIGYREGKFGQLDLLDAERTLADTRIAAIDALATYQNAKARLEPSKKDEPAQEKAGSKAPGVDENKVTLSEDQIRAAGIQIALPTIGGTGVLELPAIIEGDPQGTQVVSAAIGGRVVALSRNLGQSVGRGQTLAVIESREAAQLNGEVQATRARLVLANSNLAREQRLFAQRVSPEQDLIA